MSRYLTTVLGGVALDELETFQGTPAADFASLFGIPLGEDTEESGAGIPTPFAYWDFGINFQDAVGGLTLAIVGEEPGVGVEITTEGFLENGAQYPVSGSGSKIRGVAIPDFAENAVISFWVKDVTPTEGVNPARVNFRFDTVTQTVNILPGSMDAVYDGNWHMVTAVIRVLGDTTAIVDFYVDGVSTAGSIPLASLPVGRDIQLAMGDTGGIVSELSLWTDLNATQLSNLSVYITALYNSGNGTVWRDSAWQEVVG